MEAGPGRGRERQRLLSPRTGAGRSEAAGADCRRNFPASGVLGSHPPKEMAMAYRIAIIVGSLREGSINRKVARSICGLRNDNLDCTMIEIGDLPLYNQDLDGNPPEQWVRFRKQVGEADGVLFCSPEYNRGIPGVLKNAIDVGSRPYGQSVFDKKPAAIVTASPGSIGGVGANHQKRPAGGFLDMPVMQQPGGHFGRVSGARLDPAWKLNGGPRQELGP